MTDPLRETIRVVCRTQGRTAARGLAPQAGDQGIVLVAEEGEPHVHVQWVTGGLAGEVTAEYRENLDRVPLAPAAYFGRTGSLDADLADSLEVGAPTDRLTFLCSTEGPGGVLSVIAASRPPEFAQIQQAIRALALEEARHVSAVREVAAQLDTDEAEELIRLTAEHLIRDAVGTLSEYGD